ncbi:hypothetical protein [Archangium primigenium]|uniref:hypothetical protein n=1 Tax=[Archangium] primigenium TaxID=2792470 RepID=UPI00195C975E|nr:hypothetical protein [Archangium primigenium]MBM7115103.1 hypothetical protein [Archangium primigenium]
MSSRRLLPVLAALLMPSLAPAASVYNTWAGTPASLSALGKAQSVSEAKASSSWTVNTAYGFGYARARTASGLYEFQLVSVSPASSAGRLNGFWNVSRDGVLLCGQCQGWSSGYTSAPGKPFTINVDNGNYQLTTTITAFNDVF